MRSAPEPSKLIVAVDPGKITGVATYEIGGQFTSWERPCWDAVKLIHRGLETKRISHLVVEGYVITHETLKKTRGENWSLESIGALRYLASLYPELEEFYVQPRESRYFGTDKKLRVCGWYSRTPGGHRNDAARHLLAYLADRHLDPEMMYALAMVNELDEEE